MFPDAKWLEILKATGWQTAAIGAACWAFLLVAHWGWLPPLDAWMIQLAAAAGLLCSFLAGASFITAALKFFPIQIWIVHYSMIYRLKSGLGKYIPYMTDNEKRVISYLLANNQKTFTAAADGGYAATLLSRGIVMIVARGGQQLDPENVPMTIPDPLWDVFMRHKDKFPCAPRKRGDREVHPWRVPPMAR